MAKFCSFAVVFLEVFPQVACHCGAVAFLSTPRPWHLWSWFRRSKNCLTLIWAQSCNKACASCSVPITCGGATSPGRGCCPPTGLSMLSTVQRKSSMLSRGPRCWSGDPLGLNRSETPGRSAHVMAKFDCLSGYTTSFSTVVVSQLLGYYHRCTH